MRGRVKRGEGRGRRIASLSSHEANNKAAAESGEVWDGGGGRTKSMRPLKRVKSG